MAKIKWQGTFEQVGTGRTKVFKLNLEGMTLDDLHELIKEYVECKEASGWALIENEITEISRT